MTKKPVFVMLEPEDLEWIEDRVREGKFSSVSHGIRYAVQKLIEREKSGKA